jgi:predicted nucleotidyltransferase
MANQKPLANLKLRSYAEIMVERTNIGKFCDAVAKRFRPRKIILFGSYAYGRPTEDSDVDLLVRTPANIAKRLRWRDPFICELMGKGKVLYEAADA